MCIQADSTSGQQELSLATECLVRLSQTENISFLLVRELQVYLGGKGKELMLAFVLGVPITP